jgi:hypothetical protein
MLAVMLRVIRELQISGISNTISEDRIENAEKLYRSYYDPVRGFMLPARNITEAIGFAELFPEYLSLWLFDRKILTDEMMIRHLDRIPVMLPRAAAPYPEVGGTVRPIFIGLDNGTKGWRFFTEHWHPMASDSYAESYANHQMDGSITTAEAGCGLRYADTLQGSCTAGSRRRRQLKIACGRRSTLLRIFRPARNISQLTPAIRSLDHTAFLHGTRLC